MSLTNHNSIETIRSINIKKSPKQGGDSDVDSIPYLKELGVSLITNNQPIQFFDNRSELVHRWAPYVQGFSAAFVQKQFERFRKDYSHPLILDPFAGCGTVSVQAKLNGYESFGTELNPLLQFVSETKLNSWDTNKEKLIKISSNLDFNKVADAPFFLKNEDHFTPEVLEKLQRIKGGIDNFLPHDDIEKTIKDLLLVAFSAILIDSSNLVRSPCLGYSKKKVIDPNFPNFLFQKKINEIAHDLSILQSHYPSKLNVFGKVLLANAKEYQHDRLFDLIITSPPYMNGLDYVMNYKIEMGWLGYAQDHAELKKVKDEMVVCDNVSKGLIRDFSSKADQYTNKWLDEIKYAISENIIRRGNYRRFDMPSIVHKYFDDMYSVMSRVEKNMGNNSRFILVVGDSLIADVYVPTDLLIAKIGTDLGLEVEAIEKARARRSGQVRTYKLRESIIVLRK